MSRHDLAALQLDIGLWQQRAFGEADGRIAGTMHHLEREVLELFNALRNSDFKHSPDVAEEAADVAILLIGVCHRVGVDLGAAVDAKMLKNVSRTWKAPDGQGVIEHEK